MTLERGKHARTNIIAIPPLDLTLPADRSEWSFCFCMCLRFYERGVNLAPAFEWRDRSGHVIFLFSLMYTPLLPSAALFKLFSRHFFF